MTAEIIFAGEEGIEDSLEPVVVDFVGGDAEEIIHGSFLVPRFCNLQLR